MFFKIKNNSVIKIDNLFSSDLFISDFIKTDGFRHIYPDLKEWVDYMEESKDYKKFIIYNTSEADPIMGVMIYNPFEFRVCMVFIKDGYRRQGLFKMFIEFAETLTKNYLNVQTDSDSVVNNYLINNGYELRDVRNKYMQNSTIRFENYWQKKILN